MEQLRRDQAMNQLQYSKRVDQIATCDPARLGYGYSDTQADWRYDPAIEQPRDAWLEFLGYLHETLGGGNYLQIGLGRRGGSHLALRAGGARVVTVEQDGERVAALRSSGQIDDERDVLIIGDSRSDETVVAVTSEAAEFDALILDGEDTVAGVFADWQRYAPLVRVGGVVAIVDRSQAHKVYRERDVDTWIEELTRRVLVPCGVGCQRFGDASSIHAYRQTVATRKAVAHASTELDADTDVQSVEQCGGLALFEHDGRVFAVPAAEAPLCPRLLARNHYTLVLVAPTRAAMRELASSWTAASPRIDAALANLRDGDVTTARAAAESIGSEFPGLRRALVPGLERAPWNRKLIAALGLLGLFGVDGGVPRQGAALLRRILNADAIDGDHMKVVMAAFLQVLQDEVGARELIALAKRQVRRHKIAGVCHSELSGSALWQFPKLLLDVEGVVHVGAAAGSAVAAWSQLEIPRQVFIEGHPSVHAELQRSCPGHTVVHAVVGAEEGTAVLRHGSNAARASLLEVHPLAALRPEDRQEQALEVEVTTLDGLVASGRVDVTGCNLLFLDAEGSELDILRGATELLRQIDVLSVRVFVQPVYVGAPLPQKIQSFLREVNDDDGFVLSGFDVDSDADIARGQAVFRRRRPR